MLSETDVARDIYIVEKATPSKRSKVPKELAFEEIIKNNTLPVGCHQSMISFSNMNTNWS